MAEENESRVGRPPRRILDLAWKIATISMAAWTILGIPPIVGLLQDGTLSGIQAALAWAVPTLTVWVLAWRRRHELARAVRRRYVSAVVGLSRPVREEVVERLRGEDATRGELMNNVLGLTGLGKEMLEMLLGACAPRGEGWVVVRAVDRRLRERDSAAVTPYFDDVIHACDELQLDGFLSQVDEGKGDVWARVRFSRTVRDRFVLKLSRRVYRSLHGDGMVRVGEPEPLIWGLVAESGESN